MTFGFNIGDAFCAAFAGLPLVMVFAAADFVFAEVTVVDFFIVAKITFLVPNVVFVVTVIFAIAVFAVVGVGNILEVLKWVTGSIKVKIDFCTCISKQRYSLPLSKTSLVNEIKCTGFEFFWNFQALNL